MKVTVGMIVMLLSLTDFSTTLESLRDMLDYLGSD